MKIKIVSRKTFLALYSDVNGLNIMIFRFAFTLYPPISHNRYIQKTEPLTTHTGVTIELNMCVGYMFYDNSYHKHYNIVIQF